jgi:hypothetical protein
MARVKTLKTTNEEVIAMLVCLPNFHKSGSIKGMKRQFYGKDALLVRYGNYIYNCTQNPLIYNQYSI